MRAIEIRVAKNGYMAAPTAYDDPLKLVGSLGASVFETFESLIEWLGDNLDKPEEGPKKE